MTIFHALPFVILFLILSIQTIRLRRRYSIGVGKEAPLALQKAIRAHSNFIEYTPFTLFMIYLFDLEFDSKILMSVFLVVFFVGRVSHAYGISQMKENLKFRVFGMFCTFSVLFAIVTRSLFFYFWA